MIKCFFQLSGYFVSCFYYVVKCISQLSVYFFSRLYYIAILFFAFLKFFFKFFLISYIKSIKSYFSFVRCGMKCDQVYFISHFNLHFFRALLENYLLLKSSI